MVKMSHHTANRLAVRPSFTFDVCADSENYWSQKKESVFLRRKSAVVGHPRQGGGNISQDIFRIGTQKISYGSEKQG